MFAKYKSFKTMTNYLMKVTWVFLTVLDKSQNIEIKISLKIVAPILTRLKKVGQVRYTLDLLNTP